jgi:iron complex transport system permease protein
LPTPAAELAPPQTPAWGAIPRIPAMVRPLAIGGILVAILLAGLAASLAFGAVRIPLSEVLAALFGTATEQTSSRIVVDLRLPRAICALLAGANLAIAGALLQSVTRNPLADPGLVGVTAGASLAATIILAAIPSAALILPLVAFLGALGAAVLVYTVSWQPGSGASPIRMILAGVAINAILGAVIAFLITAFADRIPAVMFWTAGSFNGRSWSHLWLILPYSTLGLILAALLRPSLRVLELGDDAARGLGVRVERARLLAFSAAALLAGSAVAIAGAIGFVGLVVPHLVTLALGRGGPAALPLTAIAGAGLLLWSDLGARTVLAPSELPVGVITALIGGPYFVYLLYRSAWAGGMR